MTAAPASRGRIEDLTAARGHDARGSFSSSHVDLELAYSAEADLDGTFEATCLETGEHLRVNGWLFVREDL